ncbi:MAG: DUF2851 family protein [Pontiellaceae bacterium]|jgi:hypothetical protein|nr:DUF2851 family protein [Pontiellaceae bacterium]
MYTAPSIPETFFPRASAYRNRISSNEVRETAGRCFPYTERHLQALWFDDHLRPQNLKTSRGEPVCVESPGRWNLEAGPDFSGAVLRIGREQRRVAGDAEIHIFSGDWKNHGHHTDPRYAGVRFHITWFPGPVNGSLFPPGTVHLSLHDTCTADLDSMDLTAYPYSEPRAQTVFPMVGNSPDDIFQTLESAGEERLRQKAMRISWLIQQRGETQALYEETAAALGYKHNKAPFRKLAQRLPLETLAHYGTDWKTVYAVLLGISGLLPKQAAAGWPETSRNELRSLWDCWWREQHKWEETAPLDKTEWKLSGLRPLNHPLRRLCALAQWIAGGYFQSLENAETVSPSHFPTLENCFWTEHIGWTGKAQKAELVGKDREQAVFLNVILPCRLAKGDGTNLKHLPVEPINSVIRETAYTLFGPDHSPKLYRSALARQGLIQIFNDFILTGRIEELSIVSK